MDIVRYVRASCSCHATQKLMNIYEHILKMVFEKNKKNACDVVCDEIIAPADFMAYKE